MTIDKTCCFVAIPFLIQNAPKYLELTWFWSKMLYAILYCHIKLCPWYIQQLSPWCFHRTSQHVWCVVFLRLCIEKCQNSFFFQHLVPNMKSYTSQLSINQSRRSAEAVFGLTWSTLQHLEIQSFQNHPGRATSEENKAPYLLSTSVLDEWLP